MHILPPVKLDITLAELYAQDRIPGQDGRIALVLSFTNSEIAPTSTVARNTKYLYQDSTFSTTSEDLSSQRRTEIQRAVAIKYLSLVPQRDAFAAGNMPVILFDLDDSEGSTARSREEVENVISTLATHQRPELLFFPGPSQIATETNRIGRLAMKMALDDLKGSPLVVDLDTHYFLNSKAALCTSGLPRYVQVRWSTISCYCPWDRLTIASIFRYPNLKVERSNPTLTSYFPVQNLCCWSWMASALIPDHVAPRVDKHMTIARSPKAAQVSVANG